MNSWTRSRALPVTSASNPIRFPPTEYGAVLGVTTHTCDVTPQVIRSGEGSTTCTGRAANSHPSNIPKKWVGSISWPSLLTISLEPAVSSRFGMTWLSRPEEMREGSTAPRRSRKSGVERKVEIGRGSVAVCTKRTSKACSVSWHSASRQGQRLPRHSASRHTEKGSMVTAMLYIQWLLAPTPARDVELLADIFYSKRSTKSVLRWIQQ